MHWREQLTLLCITNVVELSTKSAKNLTSVLTFTEIAWDGFVPFNLLTVDYINAADSLV